MYRLPLKAFNLIRSFLERNTIQGDSPVEVRQRSEEVSRVPLLGNGAGIRGTLTSKTKYVSNPIANEYREGKLKRTLDRESKVPEI